MQKLTCLRNADGEVVGYFSDYGVAMAARQEWAQYYVRLVGVDLHCRSVETAIAPLELEDVEPGDGDRVDFIKLTDILGERQQSWYEKGAASIEVQRYLINKYRRPGMSARDSDLGGPVDAAGVLYVLRIKAPK